MPVSENGNNENTSAVGGFSFDHLASEVFGRLSSSEDNKLHRDTFARIVNTEMDQILTDNNELATGDIGRTNLMFVSLVSGNLPGGPSPHS